MYTPRVNGRKMVQTMTTPDPLGSFRALVEVAEEVVTQAYHVEGQSLKAYLSVNQEIAMALITRLSLSIVRARETLEQMEEHAASRHADDPGHLHRCLFLRSAEPPRWSCVSGCAIQRAEQAEARIVRLEEALRKTLPYLEHSYACPEAAEAFSTGLLAAIIAARAALEGRDE